MSERKEKLFALTLSPIGKPSYSDVEKATNTLLRGLKRESKKRHWSYCLYGCISNAHISNSIQWQFRDFLSRAELDAMEGIPTGEYHLHLCILSSPSETLKQFLVKHWRLGNKETFSYSPVYNLTGWLEYIAFNRRYGDKARWIAQEYPSRARRLTREKAIDTFKLWTNSADFIRPPPLLFKG